MLQWALQGDREVQCVSESAAKRESLGASVAVLQRFRRFQIDF